MTDVLLFHHALGLTEGVVTFADRLRRAGHTVHTPDLFEGRTFAAVEDGVAHAQATGFAAIVERGVAAAEGLPDDLVYAGFSLGVMPAERLAISRPGVRGAVLFHGAVDPAELGGAWPDGLPVQVHAMEHDPEFDNGYDRPAAEALVQAAGGELFLYPGDAHLFLDPTLADHDEDAAELATQRALGFLKRVGPTQNL